MSNRTAERIFSYFDAVLANVQRYPELPKSAVRLYLLAARTPDDWVRLREASVTLGNKDPRVLFAAARDLELAGLVTRRPGRVKINAANWEK